MTVNPSWPPFWEWQVTHAEYHHQDRRAARLRRRWFWARISTFAQRFGADLSRNMESGARTVAQQLTLLNDRLGRSRHQHPAAVDLASTRGAIAIGRGLGVSVIPAGSWKLPEAKPLEQTGRWATDLPLIATEPGESWHFETPRNVHVHGTWPNRAERRRG